MRRLIAAPHREPPVGRGVRSYLRSGLSETFLGAKDPARVRDDGYCTHDFCAVQVPPPAPGTVARAVIVASDGAWERNGPALLGRATSIAEDPTADVYAS